MDILGNKISAMCIMLGITLVVGLLPVWILWHFRRKRRLYGSSRHRRLDKALSLLNCVAGGVFLGTSMIHLLPEVREMVEQLLPKYNIQTHFAVTEFSVCVGFFMVMFIEHLVMSLQQYHSDVSINDVDRYSSDDDEPHLINNSIERKPLLPENQSYGSIKESEDKYTNDTLSENVENIPPPAEPITTETTGDDKEGEDSDSISFSGHHQRENHHKQHHQTSRNHNHQYHHQHRGRGEKGATVYIRDSRHHDHHLEPTQLQGIRSFLLLLALSLHTVFEGLALGLQPTTQDVWKLFIAIIIHKCIITFSLGIQFTENLKYVKKAIMFMVLFAFMSPLGVAIGTVVTEADSGNSLTRDTVSTALQALATGVFIFVTFFEVLNKEIGSDHSLIKVLTIVFGFAIIVILNLFNQHEH